MMTALSDLIERLEKAEAADREFDRDIALALCWYPHDVQDIGCYFDDPAAGCSNGEVYKPPRYTTSIDAALTLVPGRWTLARLGFDDNNQWFCELRMGFLTSYGRVIIIGKSTNGALAVCRAALKAREASQ